jgi:uncharacterized protein (DUF2336 family)
MTGFFAKLFGARPKPEFTKADRDGVRYAQERSVAEGVDVGGRLTLARSDRTHKEILFYLAEHDPEPAVRRAVAQNRSTPVQAAPKLASDSDQDVRHALAGRLVQLLPDLSRDKQAQLYSFAVQALGTLALDEVIKVRLALTSALKDRADAPPQVVATLARDAERMVSEPILRFCTALHDNVLLDILKKHPGSWVIQAIASRPVVNEQVSEAVIETRDPSAGIVLMNNAGAQISSELVDQIIEMSKTIPAWQKTLVERLDLSPDDMRELAAFVEPSIRDILINRTDLPDDVREDIAQTTKRRIEFAAGTDAQSAPARARAAMRDGNLTSDVLSDAAAMRDYDFIYEALALLNKTDRGTIDRLVALKAPKPLVALCWRAKLGMRFALTLQRDVVHVNPAELMYARGGTDYPMTEEELKWQLDFHGIG